NQARWRRLWRKDRAHGHRWRLKRHIGRWAFTCLGLYGRCRLLGLRRPGYRRSRRSYRRLTLDAALLLAPADVLVMRRAAGRARGYRSLRLLRSGRAQMAGGDRQDFGDCARMQPRRLVDIEMPDIGIRAQIDIDQRAAEARAFAHIGIVALGEIDDAADIRR